MCLIFESLKKGQCIKENGYKNSETITELAYLS